MLSSRKHKYFYDQDRKLTGLLHDDEIMYSKCAAIDLLALLWIVLVLQLSCCHGSLSGCNYCCLFENSSANLSETFIVIALYIT